MVYFFDQVFSYTAARLTLNSCSRVKKESTVCAFTNKHNGALCEVCIATTKIRELEISILASSLRFLITVGHYKSPNTESS